MRACVFDIETTSLEAVGAGVLLAVVVKPLRGGATIHRIDDYRCRPGREAPLLQAALTDLSQYDMWIGHNIENFDIGYLRSRALVLGVPWTLRPFTYDTVKAFRRMGYRTRMNGFGRPTAALSHIVDFFGYDQQKTAIYPREWWESIWADAKQRRAALDEIVAHCRADVLMTEKVYWALMPVDTRAKLGRVQ